MSSCTGKNKTQKQVRTEERIQGMRAKCQEEFLLRLWFQNNVHSQTLCKQLNKKGGIINLWSESKEVQCPCLSFLHSRSLCYPWMCLPLDHLKEKRRFISDDSSRLQPSTAEKRGPQESENSWSHHAKSEQSKTKARMPAFNSHSPLLPSSESSA